VCGYCFLPAKTTNIQYAVLKTVNAHAYIRNITLKRVYKLMGNLLEQVWLVEFS